MPERTQECATGRAQLDRKSYVQPGGHRQPAGSDDRGVHPVFPTDIPDRGAGRGRPADFVRTRQHGVLGRRSSKVHQGEEERKEEDQWLQQQRVNKYISK